MTAATDLPDDLPTKYRPRTFGEVIGQGVAMKPIARAIDKGKPFRQVLLVGPPGVGKTTIARIIGASLACEVGMSSQPCGQCRWCKSLHRGSMHSEWAAADIANPKRFSRVLISSNSIFWKEHICIINEADLLSAAVFRAMLDPLERPPRGLVFVLCAHKTGRIPEAVLSRCEKFDLSPVQEKQLVPFLQCVAKAEGATISNSDLRSIARDSGGFVRDALNDLEVAIAAR